MKKCYILCYAVGIQLLLVVFPNTNAAAQPDTTGHSIDSPREALEAVYAFTGFEEISALLEAEDYSGVQVLTLRDSTIPFLVDQVYGKPVWQIFLDNIYLDMPRCPAEEEAKWNPKQFYVLIDSTVGFFIKAYTKYEGEFDPYLGSDPPADMAERQLGGWKFQGFSRSAPKVKMHEALGAAPMSDPLASKELTIYLVKQNSRGTSTLLWNVFGRGFPPRKMRHTGGIDPLNNYAWTVVDADTGYFIWTGGAPSPIR